MYNKDFRFFFPKCNGKHGRILIRKAIWLVFFFKDYPGMVYGWRMILKEAKMTVRSQLVGYCGHLGGKEGDVPSEKGNRD